MTTARAIVAHGPLKEGLWKMQDVRVPEPKEGQILVRMVASGVCHTDIGFGSIPIGDEGAIYPRVFGHEGAGYIEKVGSKVTVGEVGDPVLLSFNSCGSCRLCHDGHPAHCNDFSPLNFVGKKAFKSSESASDLDIEGSFFGQSSFASHSIVDERSVVNVKGLIGGEEDLIQLSPLGCGIQTGTGTILTVAEATEKDVVAVIGMGGVGLSAVMGAKLANAKTIIGIDRVESRLELGKQLGATHTINTSGFDPGSPTDLGEAVRKIDKDGPTITVDTSGVPDLIHRAYEMTRARGQTIGLGMVPPKSMLTFIDMTEMTVSGKKFLGAIEGDSVPGTWVPKMIQWWKEGKLPFDKFVKTFKADDFAKAIHEMHTGETVKPIIVW